MVIFTTWTLLKSCAGLGLICPQVHFTLFSCLFLYWRRANSAGTAIFHGVWETQRETLMGDLRKGEARAFLRFCLPLAVLLAEAISFVTPIPIGQVCHNSSVHCVTLALDSCSSASSFCLSSLGMVVPSCCLLMSGCLSPFLMAYRIFYPFCK